MEAKRAFRIGISGSYGGMNLGDEAILEGLLSELRAHVRAEVTVFSRNPADTLQRHAVEHVVSPSDLTRPEMRAKLQGLDLLVLGGGGILYDRHAESYLREVTIAHEIGLPVFVYAISAGPLTLPSSRLAVKEALNRADTITVRDRQGYRLLEDIGVTHEIHLTADPALLIEPEELSVQALTAEGVELSRRLVGFSVREPGPAAPDLDPEKYHALLANAADFIVERYDADVVFVPMEKADVQHSHGVISHMQHSEHAELLRRRYSPRQILHLMGRFELAVGMRLHFLIFAALQRTPFTALPYASKVIGLLDHLEMEAPRFERIGIGQLIARIDRTWDRRADIKVKIGERLPELKAQAKKTNELLVDALRRIEQRRATGAAPNGVTSP